MSRRDDLFRIVPKAQTEEDRLAALRKRTEAFLALAADAPAPIPIEEGEDLPDDDNDAAPEGGANEADSEPTIRMNLLLGVLEPLAPPPMKDGILIPTPETVAALERQDLAEAQKMMNVVLKLQQRKAFGTHSSGNGGEEDRDENDDNPGDSIAVTVKSGRAVVKPVESSSDDDTSSCDEFFDSSSDEGQRGKPSAE